MLEGGECGAECALAGADVLLEGGIGEPGDDVVGEAAGEWVAAEGGAVVAGDDAVRDGVGDHGCADGEAVAERLRRGEDVWVRGRGEPVVCPEVAGARKAALDFVED